jgi:hypothetical protein
MTWVTPSPESMTVPVRVLFLTSGDVHDAAKASTACTAMYSPGTLKVSNMISAVVSLAGRRNMNYVRVSYFIQVHTHTRNTITPKIDVPVFRSVEGWFCKHDIVLLGLATQVLENTPVQGDAPRGGALFW